MRFVLLTKEQKDHLRKLEYSQAIITFGRVFQGRRNHIWLTTDDRHTLCGQAMSQYNPYADYTQLFCAKCVAAAERLQVPAAEVGR